MLVYFPALIESVTVPTHSARPMPRKPSNFHTPFLKRLWTDMDALVDRKGYPFDLPLVRKGGVEIDFERPVTVIVGENGTGKSTVLEAIAENAGFGKMGGTRNTRNADWTDEKYVEAEVADAPSPATAATMIRRSRAEESLSAVLRLAWLPKVTSGFFFRAETFHRLARYMDEVAAFNRIPAQGPEHLKMSHAEGFLDFFEARFSGPFQKPHLFIFDEPESALSPRRQIDFLKMIAKLEETGMCQIVIATHSPVLMAYPHAQLLRLSRGSIDPCALEQTDHFRFLREFYLDPAGFIDATMND
jgi:predicted ATPase